MPPRRRSSRSAQAAASNSAGPSAPAKRTRPIDPKTYRRPSPDEEVFSVKSVSDSSEERLTRGVEGELVDEPPTKRPRRGANGSSRHDSGGTLATRNGRLGGGRKSGVNEVDIVVLSDEDAGTNGDHSQRQAESAAASTLKEGSSEEDMEDLEEVELPARPRSGTGNEPERGDVEGENHEIIGDDDEEDEEEDDMMEEVDLEPGAEDNEAYAAAYEAADAAADEEGEGTGTDTSVPIFKDGKGQPGGISISLHGPQKRALELKLAAKRKGPVITHKDRTARLAAHKWMVLSVIAHTKARNELINDEALRDHLYTIVPNNFLEKLRLIHPKKVPVQNERVRMFESLLRDITRWWVSRFRLEPNMTAGAALRQPDPDSFNGLFPAPGRRVDGWVVETAKQREDRHREVRKLDAQKSKEVKKKVKGKGKAKVEDDAPTNAGEPKKEEEDEEKQKKRKAPFSEITLFGPGNSTQPHFLRLGDAAEPIYSAQELMSHARELVGSRETSAQLFASMCRALGIPSRLVVSVQAPSWSVAAAKIASTVGATAEKPKMTTLGKKRKAMRRIDTRTTDESEYFVARRKAEDVMTSDDESFTGGGNTTSAAEEDHSPKKKGIISRALASRQRLKNGTASKPASVASTASVASVPNSPSRTRASIADAAPSRQSRANGRPQRGIATKAQESSKEIAEISRDESKVPISRAKRKGKAKDAGPGTPEKNKDDDYRDEKWKNLEAPLEVEYRPKLRPMRAKQLKDTEIGSDNVTDVKPVDMTAPPTMWVEVFSKPWQRWITVDVVRNLVEPTGSRRMEPLPSDRSNRLIYVVAFEEDGYARDVTARYTRTLHSRISRMRPPATKRKGSTTLDEWWPKVVKAIHRPQKLERDAMEDVELGDAASREPMPSSVAAFKDHPVYALEKHLKRDEVIFPAKQAGTFQGTPVFLRRNVVLCRSARQWYNEGKVVREGEEALKWVRSRGYTLANKRAEEQARMEGGELPQEGLYADFQTVLYVPPPVAEDGTVPTNVFGNIDLFVPSMLPEGAAHLPYNGVGKVAKSLGIQYAEAIIGFEFRKHRSMPKMSGIVVAAKHHDALLDAYWTSEHVAAEREQNKRVERAIKNWKRLLNSLRITERVRREYGQDTAEKGADEEEAEMGREQEQEEDGDARAYRSLHAEHEQGEEGGGGGFMFDDE